MTSAAEDEYPLERSPLGSSRLYVQHWLWQRKLGHLLHPSIPIKENVKIADIACGTGIWLIDLAKELAKSNTNVQLHGFDISTAQYPPSALLPSNIRLDTLDIFKPIPETLRGKYDVIHLSLLCLVIPDGDPRSVLDNVLTLLKPGGYIQWKEIDFSMMTCAAAGQDVSINNLSSLRDWMYEVPLKKFPSFDWIPQLSSIFQERGLTILAHQYLAPESDIAYAWTLMHMNGIQELINVAAGGSDEGIYLHRRAAQEVHKGACLSMMLVNVVGRRAEHS